MLKRKAQTLLLKRFYTGDAKGKGPGSKGKLWTPVQNRQTWRLKRTEDIYMLSRVCPLQDRCNDNVVAIQADGNKTAGDKIWEKKAPCPAVQHRIPSSKEHPLALFKSPHERISLLNLSWNSLRMLWLPSLKFEPVHVHVFVLLEEKTISLSRKPSSHC